MNNCSFFLQKYLISLHSITSCSFIPFPPIIALIEIKTYLFMLIYQRVCSPLSLSQLECLQMCSLKISTTHHLTFMTAEKENFYNEIKFPY